MLIDGRTTDAAEYDAEVCIVGAGAAGITCAVELARRGIDVLIAEAGGASFDSTLQDALRASHWGPDHDPPEFARLRQFGGTTEQWGGRCAPLDELDLAPRSEIGRPGWPLPFAALDSWYPLANRYCEAGPYSYRLEGLEQEIAPYIATCDSSPIDDRAIWRWGPPTKFGRRYRTALTASRSVRLITYMNAVSLEREPVSGRIERVEARSASGKQISLRARCFVLAAGGLETIRILHASRSATSEAIGNEYDLLGRYYMTHPTVETGELMIDRERAAAGLFGRTSDGVYYRRIVSPTVKALRAAGLPKTALAVWYPDPRDPAHGDGLLSAYALARLALTKTGRHWKSSGAQRRFGETGETRQHLVNVVSDLPHVASAGYRFALARWAKHYSVPSLLVLPKRGSLRFRIDMEQLPEASNRVTLGREKDHFGVPRLRIDYRLGEAERVGVIRTLELVDAELRRTRTGSVHVPAFEELSFFGMGAHQLGGVRMAGTPRQGVTDADCRMFAARNLFVAGSAVFPSGGAVGPTLTIVALAARVADRIAREIREVIKTAASGEGEIQVYGG